MGIDEAPAADIRLTGEGASSPVNGRVAAEAMGSPVWFEASNGHEIALTAAPEAFGSAFFIPALHAAQRLRLEQGVCSEWLENLGRMLPILEEWWGYPQLLPLARQRATDDRMKGKRARGAGTALCFSGGVDSFYSLLRGDLSPRLLLYVHGYDIPLADEARLSTLAPALAEVAVKTGARAVVLRTNLREHPAFNICSWERTHGGALAAVGHLLADEIDRFIISATLAREDERAWGSHWRLDHLWSSAGMRVRQCGEKIWRHEKLRAIIDEPLAQKHLRVCWENRVKEGNCSRCDKCIMTMIVIAQAGRLGRFGVFECGGLPDPWKEIEARIERLPRTIYVRTYAMLLGDGLDRRGARAVRRLLDRSRTGEAKRSRLRFPSFLQRKEG